jgi:hypothetical protein
MGRRTDRAHTRRRERRHSLVALVAMLAIVAVVAAVLTIGIALRNPSHSSVTPAKAVGTAASFAPRMVFLRSILEPTVSPSAGNSFSSVKPPNLVAMHRPVSGRPLRIMIVGDSVGRSFEAGMNLWAGERGDVQVLAESHEWCPLGRRLPIQQGLGAHVPGSGCDDWASYWSSGVRSFDPDVTIVLFSIWEVAPRQLPGRHDWLQPGAPALDAWQLSEYRAAADVLSARGAPVVWLTVPCPFGAIQHGEPLWYLNRRTIPALAASRPAVHVVDLDHELCAGGASHDYAGVHDARPDGTHFSVAGALAASKWLMPIVLGETPNPVTVDETDPPPR